MSDWNTHIIEEFRANAGIVGGNFTGKPVLILHSTGARSGREHVNPLMYKSLGPDSLAIFASKGGAPGNPDWYFNLVANPRASVEVGTESFPVQARVAPSEEREGIWEPWKVEFPQFEGYEQNTTRQIPVVILDRAS
jgi:deazaflavin-dependent oxidoreductase (nitroreductase family)